MASIRVHLLIAHRMLSDDKKVGVQARVVVVFESIKQPPQADIIKCIKGDRFFIVSMRPSESIVTMNFAGRER